MSNYQTRRKELGLTREQLAGAAGLSLSTITRAEAGKSISRLATAALETTLAKFERKKASA